MPNDDLMKTENNAPPHVDYGGGLCWFCGKKPVPGEVCQKRLRKERCPVCGQEDHAFDCR
jgi:hypothetical protein